MRLYGFAKFFFRVLVVVLGSSQTALAVEGILDFSLPNADSAISVPANNDSNPAVSSMPTSELFTTAKSTGSIAVGVAEGNLTASGKVTSLYWGHTDPGNNVTNRGFCSWNRAENISVKEADRRCLKALQRQSEAIARALRELGLAPEIHLEAVVNGTDVWNQSNGAGPDFPKKYKEAIDKGMRDREAFLHARVESFRTPSGVLSASGLFRICRREGYYKRKLAGLTPDSEEWRWQCIALDQGRRVDAVRQALSYKEDNTPIAPPDTVQNAVVSTASASSEKEESRETVQARSPVVFLSFELDAAAPAAAPAQPESRAIESINTDEKTSGGWEGKTVKFAKKSFLATSPKRGDTVGPYSVASPFGWRPKPCAVCSGYHNGVDVGTPMQTPLYAIALPAHTINVACYNTQLGGLTAIVKSESIPDRSFAAVHLSSCFPGTHKAGKIFALTGNSGQATTGPHLHWVEKVNGEAVPPQRGFVEWAITGKIPEQSETKLIAAGSDSSTLYGHFAYSEAPQWDLVEVGNRQKLRRAAATAFKQMVAAAARQGIAIAPLSGFRDKYTQHQLFYGVAAKRGQNWQERAKVSAPPGYSEHHTGYAIDLGDGSFPGRNLGESFENTPAFRWLLVNAESYGFEMSFPRNNPQGVGYEPWHWRFVGDADSQETFKAARGGVKPFSF